MATQFILIDRDTPYILPPCVQDYLPEEHMARFVVEIVDQLDLGALSAVYAGKGKRPYHPAMLLALLFYGYATGVFSSRKLEKATHDSMAFKYICANENPDHDTINSFRKRFGKEIEGLFVEIWVLAEALGLLKLGTVSLDGTKIKANAGKHKALSWDYANQLEARFKQEVDTLMKLAEAADNTPLPEDMDVPKELKRRQDRLVVIAKAKQEIQTRAKVRYTQEKAEYDEKPAKREKHLSETGKKMGGKVPQAPIDAPQGKDQVSLTDEESRIMPTPNGFEQAYNAQASVDIASHLIVAHHVSQHTNDKQEIEPALTKRVQLPECLGTVDNLLADTGYFSQANVKACADAKINPYLAQKRQRHNQTLEARFQHQSEIDETPLSPIEAMTHRLPKRAKRFTASENQPLKPCLASLNMFRGSGNSMFEAWNPSKVNGI